MKQHEFIGQKSAEQLGLHYSFSCNSSFGRYLDGKLRLGHHPGNKRSFSIKQ